MDFKEIIFDLLGGGGEGKVRCRRRRRGLDDNLSLVRLMVLKNPLGGMRGGDKYIKSSNFLLYCEQIKDKGIINKIVNV